MQSTILHNAILQCVTVHRVPKFTSCYNAVMVVTGRAHCILLMYTMYTIYIYIYIYIYNILIYMYEYIPIYIYVGMNRYEYI